MSLANEKPVDACSYEKVLSLQGWLGQVLRSTSPILDIWFAGEQTECLGCGDEKDQNPKSFSAQIKVRLEDAYITRNKHLAFIQGHDLESHACLLIPFCSFCNPVYDLGAHGTICSTRIEKIRHHKLGEIIFSVGVYPIETVYPDAALLRGPDYTVIETTSTNVEHMIKLIGDRYLMLDEILI